MDLLARLLPIFAQTILPVFLAAATGLVLARSMQVDGRTLGRVLFYICSPALVLRSLSQMELSGEALRQVVTVTVTIMVTTALLGWLVSANMGRKERAAITLTSGISNNGNMGIPVSLFAFGNPGVELATIYYVISSIMTNTVGSIVASAGSRAIRDAVAQVVRVPMIYAALLGLLLNWTSIAIPAPIFRAVDLLGSAAVPLMLIMLGIQLSNASFLQRQQGVARSLAVRLLVSPLLSWGLCSLLGITGLARSVMILQSAMPSAVILSVLAGEYDTAPRLVATIIVLSTLASMVTLSLILALLL